MRSARESDVLGASNGFPTCSSLPFDKVTGNRIFFLIFSISCGDGRILLYNFARGLTGLKTGEDLRQEKEEELSGCSLCGSGSNSPEHFFLECPALARPRTAMLQVQSLLSIVIEYENKTINANFILSDRVWRRRCRGCGGRGGNDRWRFYILAEILQIF